MCEISYYTGLHCTADVVCPYFSPGGSVNLSGKDMIPLSQVLLGILIMLVYLIILSSKQIISSFFSLNRQTDISVRGFIIQADYPLKKIIFSFLFLKKIKT